VPYGCAESAIHLPVIAHRYGENVFVKICGITNEADALFAVAMGADALGFVFATSPRQVSVTAVADIVKRLPPDVVTIGVFRNEHPKRVVEIVQSARLHGAQLHGAETPLMVSEVAGEVRLVIKAVVAGSHESQRAADFGADAVLVDGAHPGSGERYDLGMLSDFPRGVRMILSGGLGPDNVAEAINVVKPWGVDVSTGVENSPGVKDALKVRTFIANARRASAEAVEPIL
jgi:phosphoribosylanthranilate isomerase